MENKEIGIYVCQCNKCNQSVEFCVTHRYMKCGGCDHKFDVYNHEDEMPVIKSYVNDSCCKCKE